MILDAIVASEKLVFDQATGIYNTDLRFYTL